MVSLTRNVQGRFEFSTIDDKGFHRGKAILLGVAGYESCIGRIIGRILSLFGLTVRMELKSSDQSKKSYVWINVSSIKSLVERNTDNGISKGNIELPKSFNSKTVEVLVCKVKTYNEIKEQETWVPQIFGNGGPLHQSECSYLEPFFNLARNNTYPELTGLKEDLKEFWKCTKASFYAVRFETRDYLQSNGKICSFNSSNYGSIGLELKFFKELDRKNETEKKEALTQFQESIKNAITFYKTKN